jgi:hypothetical protein
VVTHTVFYSPENAHEIFKNLTSSYQIKWKQKACGCFSNCAKNKLRKMRVSNATPSLSMEIFLYCIQCTAKHATRNAAEFFFRIRRTVFKYSGGLGTGNLGTFYNFFHSE